VPPLQLDDVFINEQKAKMPRLPADIRKILNKSSISESVIEDLLDNQSACKKVLEAAEQNLDGEIVRRIAFDTLEEPESLGVDIQDHIKIAEMLQNKELSSSAAKEILLAKFHNPDKSIDELSSGKKQLSDEGAIEKIVAEVLAENQKAAADVKNGEMKAIGFLVGQVMAKSKGQANPSMAQELIKRQLGL